MSHTPSRHKQHQEWRRRKLIAENRTPEDIKAAGEIVEVWNARQAAGAALWFYPGADGMPL